MVRYTLFVRLVLQLEIDSWSCKLVKELNWSTRVGGNAEEAVRFRGTMSGLAIKAYFVWMTFV